jgi:hypothetical protein
MLNTEQYAGTEFSISGWSVITGQSPESHYRDCEEKCMVLQGDLLSRRRVCGSTARSWERKVRQNLRGRCCLAVVGLSRQHAFAPNPIVKFTVHLLQTASPADNRIVFSREELRRRKIPHSLHRVALGLCTEAESGIKSMRYRTTRNRNPREWAEIGR